MLKWKWIIGISLVLMSGFICLYSWVNKIDADLEVYNDLERKPDEFYYR